MKEMNLAFFIASKPHDESLKNFLQRAENEFPEAFADILCAKTNKGWNLGQYIAAYQNHETLTYYLNLVIRNAPNALPELLNCREAGLNLIDIAIKNYPRVAVGGIIYQLFSNKVPVGDVLFQRFYQYKLCVLEHISRLPPQEQVKALADCLDKTTPLGLYIGVKKDFVHRQFGNNKVLIDKIHSMQEQAKADLDFPVARNTKRPLENDCSTRPSFFGSSYAYVELLDDPVQTNSHSLQ